MHIPCARNKSISSSTADEIPETGWVRIALEHNAVPNRWVIGQRTKYCNYGNF